jgi:Nif-specific regulatory protein
MASTSSPANGGAPRLSDRAELVELAQLLSVVMAKTNELIECESSAVLLLDERTNELFFPYVVDVASDVASRLSRVRFKADQGIAGWVLAHGEVQVIHNVSRDPRWYSQVDGESGGNTRSLLCAPLMTRQRVVGVIELRNKRSGEFTARDVSWIGALAEIIAVAIENAQLFGAANASVARLREEVGVLQRAIARQSRFEDVVGSGPAMERVFSLMESAILSPVTVLLRGETGTGKELIARAIHYHGPRRERPFVAVNCGALTETLLESELFGHRKGSFTGALADRKGLFEIADGGTIFLDEIGDMPLVMQVKLLRTLQEGEILPVGDSTPRRVDVRVISATHRNLEKAVEAERFRPDLYYRLSAFPIEVPALRDRREDLPLLATYLLERTMEKFHKRIAGFDPAALERIVEYSWPGNVRELQNEIERAVALAKPDEPIEPIHLSEKLARRARPVLPPHAKPMSLRQAREWFERRYIVELLEHHGGNVSQTARVLGISRTSLHQRIRQFELRKPLDPEV